MRQPAARRVAIIGGGLAGLSAAVALCEHVPPEVTLEIELFESRRRVGGRATSYQDVVTGELVDHCQHVSMGCCTAFSDLCERTDLRKHFLDNETLHFFSPAGRRHDFRAVRWLPAPLHLLPGFGRLGYLTLRDRWNIVRSLGKLMRYSPAPQDELLLDWLRQHRNSNASIELFWAVVLVSALGESIEQVSVAAARKVFVDGFLSNRRGYVVEVPQLSLDDLFGTRLAQWLIERKVRIRTSTMARSIHLSEDGVHWQADLSNGHSESFEQIVVAVPWHKVDSLLDAAVIASIPRLAAATQLPASPISGVHLWLDRPITELSHAVMVGTLGQWVFRRGARPGVGNAPEHYVQVVISASRTLAEMSRDQLLKTLRAELATVFPDARQARVLRWQPVTEHQAVFSLRPDLARTRPTQATALPGLTLAGDWTDTGWPATMEGAVRSGYLAAEAIFNAWGLPRVILPVDLPRGLLARLLIA